MTTNLKPSNYEIPHSTGAPGTHREQAQPSTGTKAYLDGAALRLSVCPVGPMIEVLAAVAGASISVAAMGAMGYSKRTDEARDAVIRLTMAVEHIATQLEVLHSDIKEDRKETFGRLSTVEQRVSKLEARPPSC